jgi:hypothetical protein
MDPGGCIPICPPGSDLVDGKCVFGPCPKGQIRINDHCIDPCPTGQVFDGVECACAPGTVQTDDGTCHTKCPDGSTPMANGDCPIECGPDEIPFEGECVKPCQAPAVLTKGECKVPRCPKGSIRIDNICTGPCPPGQIYQDEIRTCMPFRKRCPEGLVRFSVDDECTSPCRDDEWLVDDECMCVVGKQRNSATKFCEDIIIEPTGPEPAKDCLSGIITGKCSPKPNFKQRDDTDLDARKMLHPNLRERAEIWLPRSLRLLYCLLGPPIQQVPSLPQRNLLSRRRSRSRGVFQLARNLRQAATRVEGEEQDLCQQRPERRVHDPHVGLLGER